MRSLIGFAPVRARRASFLTAGGLLAALALFGCSTASAPPTTSGTSPPLASATLAPAPVELSPPTPSATVELSARATILPDSLSAEELQAAENAVAAVKAFEYVSDYVTRSGGAHSERFEKISTQTALEDGRDLATIYSTRGWQSDGDIALIWIDVTDVSMNADSPKNAAPEVKVEACIDASQTSVTDATGKFVAKPPLERIFLNYYSVRYYPKDPHGGINGWFVGNTRNKQVDSCDR